MVLDLLIVGSGSLAEALLFSLAILEPGRLRIAVVARNRERLSWLQSAASAQAFAVGHDHIIYSYHVDKCDEGGISSALHEFRPRLVLHAASLQSAWDLGGNDGWSQFVQRCGYGVTTPLQLALALEVARAIRSVHPASLLVNAAYPDVINPLLRELGHPICCGIGNVAILAAFAGARLAVKPAALKMIGHHAHVTRIIAKSNGPPPRVWINGAERSVGFDQEQLPSTASLNQVTGASAVPLILALLGRQVYEGHAPGPDGLPGGYPIFVGCGRVDLRLPASLSREDAISWNLEAERDDGVTREKTGKISFGEAASRELGHYDPMFLSALSGDGLADCTVRMLNLRRKLRLMPQPG